MPPWRPAPPALPARLTPQAVFAFRNAQEPRLSPDGSRLAALLLRRDPATDRRVTSLLLARLDADAWTEHGPASGHAWAPDNRRLALLRRDGPLTALLVLDADTGAETPIARAEALRDPAWSPDGRTLAWQATVPAPPPAWLPLPPDNPDHAPPGHLTERLVYRHDNHGDLQEGSAQLFVAPADGTGTPRQVTDGPWHGGFLHPSGLLWTPDGPGRERELVLAANRRPDWDRAPNDTDLHAVRLADGRVRALTDRRGPVATPALSPDGTSLAFTAVEWRGLSAHERHAYVMPLAGGEARRVAPSLGRSVDGLAWAADGALLLSYDDRGEKHLARVAPEDLHGAAAPAVLMRDVGGANIESPYSSGSFHAAAGLVVATRSDAATPCEIVLLRPDAPRTALTALNDALAESVGGFRPAETFTTPSTLDGLPIQCWLQRPHGDAPAPLILHVHGGPFACYGDRFSIKHQVFLAAGYAVLSVNPRGSIGYGEDFACALHDRHPGPDGRDLLDALEAALARGGLDADRLFVTGTSGGGVLTLWCVAHSARFRAAVSIKPVVSQESWLLTADIGPMLGETWFAGVLPWQDPEKFRARSPLHMVERIRTPTLLVAGLSDHRTPSSEAQQMFAALKLQGVETALLRQPGVPHTTQSMRPSQYAEELSATLGWFARFGGPAAPPDSASGA